MTEMRKVTQETEGTLKEVEEGLKGVGLRSLREKDRDKCCREVS